MQPTPTANANPSLLKPNERVLSTLQADGSRRWLHPRLSKGNFWNARRWTAYLLIAIYAVIPYLWMNGHPLILLDIVHRRFHIFGITFLPTDTKLLALLLLMVGLTIFTATAIMGRVFCGWACPQTVYLEFVFRPIERLFTGTTGRGGKAKNVPAWRRIAMYVVYLVIAVHLAHTLLAYFIGANQVHEYIWNSTPFQHPAAFIVVALATAWIMWDFAYWREQMCIIGCPYGRMQSVLLDRNSLIVSYDYRRGEPRGKGARGQAVAQTSRPDF
jgi:cytochrome c oxidase accessory protein FixG